MKSKLVIAIDGPAGAGKSTVAKALAEKLHLTYLDSGAIYRALVIKIQQLEVSAENGAEIAKVAKDTTIAFGESKNYTSTVLLDGVDVSHLIRTPEISDLASAISVFPEVREVVVDILKGMISQGNAILEGRDATTVVAPQAPIRVFLTASLDERARRRHLELLTKDPTITFDQVREQIAQRDFRDTTREASPLILAEGVTELISDNLTVEDVVEKVAEMVDCLPCDCV